MRAITRVAGALSVLAMTAASAQAQRPTHANVITVDRGQFAIAPYAGYLLNQNFINGPLSTKLSVQSAALYGVQASLPLAPSASLVGGIGYANGDLKAGIPIIGGFSFGKSGTTIYDASVELRGENFGKTRAFIPIVQLGGGAIHRTVTVAGVTAKTTDFEVSGGLGADVPITQNFAIRVLARDHYGKANFGSFAGYDFSTDDMHAVALTAGARIAF
jgi:hypothetical protein